MKNILPAFLCVTCGDDWDGPFASLLYDTGDDSSLYELVETKAICSHCGKNTAVLALRELNKSTIEA